jgi:hypothetical protein
VTRPPQKAPPAAVGPCCGPGGIGRTLPIVPLQVPYTDPQAYLRYRPYNGLRSIGASAPAGCPSRPWWWLVAAAALGAAAGYKLVDAKKKPRRRRA